jgi:hypothetical protein
MTSRRQTITELLDHLTDYEPAPKTGGERGGSGGTPRTPLIASNPTIRELYRCLNRLASTSTITLRSGNVAWGSTIHAHLTAFYHSEYRTVRPKKKKRIIRGRVTWVESSPNDWRRDRVVSGWLIPHDWTPRQIDRAKRGLLLPPLVEAGVAYVDREFSTSRLCSFEDVLAWVAKREAKAL